MKSVQIGHYQLLFEKNDFFVQNLLLKAPFTIGAQALKCPFTINCLEKSDYLVEIRLSCKQLLRVHLPCLS